MTLASILVFSIPVLSGILLVHLIWPEKGGEFFLLKVSLGLGLGMGFNSILYFLTLLITPTFQGNLLISIGILIALVILTILKERNNHWSAIKFSQISRIQWILIGLTFITFILSGLTFFNLTKARPQGSYDAWGIWNRAARFIYRDPENWKATLSPDLYWGTHPDYPLLIPLNVAWGWNMIGEETLRTPAVQSSIFVIGTFLLMFSAIKVTRTLGQASLASLTLLSTPIFISVGYGQIADVPLAFYILATCVLIYLYLKLDQPKLLLIAGFMAGMGAWTKNEGLLFLIVSFPALFLAFGGKSFFRLLGSYLLGLAIPLTVILFFKTALAPSSDLFTLNGDNGNMLTKITDIHRYWTITKAFTTTLLTYPGWPFSLTVQLAIYTLIIRMDMKSVPRQGINVLTILIFLQLAGYAVIFVMTPHDLEWHLRSSLTRLIFHIIPAGIFLLFNLLNEPENIFLQNNGAY